MWREQSALIRLQFVQRASTRLKSRACIVLLLTLAAASCRFPGSVRPTVKIGLVAPFEGRYRAIGYDVIYAVRLALREANAAGGIGGYSVELTAYDDGADPSQAELQARKLAIEDEVIAVIGHFHECTTLAALPVYVQENIPLLAPAVYSAALTANDAPIYRLGPSSEALASTILRRLIASGVTRVVLLTSGGPLAHAFDAATTVSNVAVTHVVATIGKDREWLQELSTVLYARNERTAIVLDTDAVTAGEAVQLLRSIGWQGPVWGGPDLASGDFRAVASVAAAGVRYITPWPNPDELSGTGEFIAAYRAVSGGVTPGPYALVAYEATWVLLEALERDIAMHGRPSRAGVAAALLSTQRNGLLGHIAFDATRSWSPPEIFERECDDSGAATEAKALPWIARIEQWGPLHRFLTETARGEQAFAGSVEPFNTICVYREQCLPCLEPIADFRTQHNSNTVVDRVTLFLSSTA